MDEPTLGLGHYENPANTQSAMTTQQPKPCSLRNQQAIAEIALLIRDSPDTSGGVQLWRFLWSLYNMHHVVNLWDLASRVGGQLAEPVSEIIRAALAGELRETDVKQGLALSGEMEWWDATAPNGDALECMDDAERLLISAVRRIPPCQEHTELVRTLGALTRLRSDVRSPGSPQNRIQVGPRDVLNPLAMAMASS